MRINKFNEDYIMLSIKEIDDIVYDNTNTYDKTLKILLYNVKKEIDKFIAFNCLSSTKNIEITINKDSQVGILILNNIKLNTNEKIYEDMLINAIIIANHKGKYEYARILSEIIIKQSYSKYDYQEEYSIFEIKYGKDLAKFVLDNSDISEYVKVQKGHLPHEEDRNVLLYENGIIAETFLTLPVREKTKVKK